MSVNEPGPLTSGTSIFNLDINTIVEEAYERCGQELRTGYDLKTAIRSLNLMTIDWANRGYNLWLLDRVEIPLVKGINIYTLPVDTIDIVDSVIQTGTPGNLTDITISRISASVYFSIPNKGTLGRPIQFRFLRHSGANYPAPTSTYDYTDPNITLWPMPDRDNFYIFRCWRLRRIQDAGTGQNTMDIPFRFLPAMVAGLAYYLSKKLPGGMERMEALKAEYDEAFQQAIEEDREKSPVRFVPRQLYI